MDRSREFALRFAPPGHFYSPHADLDQIEDNAHSLFHRPSPKDLPAIDLNVAAQLSLLSRFSQFYKELPWIDATQPSNRYHLANDFFGHGDGIILYCMMRAFRPRRIIEIGSGFSSAAMLDVVELFFDEHCDLRCIEPHPQRLRALLRPDDEGQRLIIMEQKLQDVCLDLFDGLAGNDFLFVDSSHVSKIGSDVNLIFFELLPRLHSGTIIHFHDIFYPFEYPKEWILEGRAWNEAYLLRAFLQFNPAFEVLFFNDFLHQCANAEIAAKLPATTCNPGGSLWLRKVC